jgi:hypothetical protein
VNDLERWINLEGPAPKGVRRLLEAAQGVPELTPEHQERLDRDLDRAFAEERRRWERQRMVKRVTVAAVAALAIAAGVLLAVRYTQAPADPVADKPKPTQPSKSIRSGELPRPNDPGVSGSKLPPTGPRPSKP